MEIFSRNVLFWGEDSQKLLAEKHVAVFGLGGVGGFCAEALVRSGIGELTIVDFDKVSSSNINRQLIALNSTVGKSKVELFKTRLKDINPDIKLNVVDDFYTSETKILDGVDYVADAIDTMRSKISLLEYCHKNDIPVITSMGAGNRMDPTKLYVSDISKMENRNAPFISNVLYQLKKRGITQGITVVASRETPHCEEKLSEQEKIITKSGEKIEFTKITPSSTPFVASCSGIFMASEIVKGFINE
ncbi:MAG: tRNA threonylcarbamoyladenosine dehydratase [Clostridiaceae bacterium]|nr:tRNA threonylcarbamoyladenosine dehydratase [Clostridiaceae bacterium]